MLGLLLCFGSSPVFADEDTPAIEEIPATEETPAGGEESEEPAVEEDGWEDADPGEEEVIDEVFDEEVIEEEVIEEEPPPDNPVLGYHHGFEAGQADSKLAKDYALHGLAGFGAGCLIGPCGCVAVPAIEAVVVPGVPAGPWQGYGSEYQQGYIEGYRRGVQRRRVVYSLVGATVGTVIGVGTGLAFGAFV